MRRGAAAFATALTTALALIALQSALVAADEGGKPAPKAPCEVVTKQVQYRGLGYQHAVTIRNTCDHEIACTIKASSNPETLTATVGPQATASVAVHSGSPAREFSAEVRCK
jgi:hypothetical protein